MNKLLPKTKNNQRLPKGNSQGFTLVELLVVIVILAILGVVGVTIFTSTQSKARDAKRKEDIQAIGQALEANYVAGTGYTTTLSTAWFADQNIPDNPGPGGAVYASPTLNSVNYVLCASLENSTGNATTSTATSIGQTSTGVWFCKRNAQ